MKTQSRTVRSAPAKGYSSAATVKTRPTKSGGERTKSSKSSSTVSGSAGGTGSRRKFIVFVSLVGLLSLTSVLLLALAAPLTQRTAASLFAIDQPNSMNGVFETGVPVVNQRWRSVFIHHSRTSSGNADTLASRAGGLADHFVIGNGAGCVDGEVQVGHRWSAQLSAGEVPGTRSVAADCITICVVGDFDRTEPTPTQRVRLNQLVHTLQGRLGVSADRVYLHQGTGTAADIGRGFPLASFREQLLP